MFRAGDHDLVLGLGRDLGGAARPTSPRGPALVSGSELFEDWLALGAVCSDAMLRADHNGVLK